VAKKTSAYIKCVDYDLKVEVNETGPLFDFHATGDDNVSYNLRVMANSKKKKLIQALLHKLAELWPANDFEFLANEENEIEKIKDK